MPLLAWYRGGSAVLYAFLIYVTVQVTLSSVLNTTQQWMWQTRYFQLFNTTHAALIKMLDTRRLSLSICGLSFK